MPSNRSRRLCKAAAKIHDFSNNFNPLLISLCCSIFYTNRGDNKPCLMHTWWLTKLVIWSMSLWEQQQITQQNTPVDTWSFFLLAMASESNCFWLCLLERMWAKIFRSSLIASTLSPNYFGRYNPITLIFV